MDGTADAGDACAHDQMSEIFLLPGWQKRCGRLRSIVVFICSEFTSYSPAPLRASTAIP